MFFISEQIEKYCADHSTLPSTKCNDIEKFTRTNRRDSIMLTGPLEGSLLGFLVGLTRATRVLEIGCFTGYSALCMAERLPSNGELITLDTDPDTTAIARRFWNESAHGSNIKEILGPAKESLSRLEPGFDLIFIDADKPSYLDYLRLSLPLLSPNGLIIVDNTLYFGQVLESVPTDERGRALQTFNHYVKEEPSLESIMLPVRDGITLIRRKTQG